MKNDLKMFVFTIIAFMFSVSLWVIVGKFIEFFVIDMQLNSISWIMSIPLFSYFSVILTFKLMDKLKIKWQ